MKIAIIYSSKRGTTERMANLIKERLLEVDSDLYFGKASETAVEELHKYDLLVLGSSTWHDGDLEDGFFDLEVAMSDESFAGKKAAIFGSGNSRFTFFCEAVEILENRMKNCDAKIVIKSLKADQLQHKVLESTESWCDSLLKNI